MTRTLPTDTAATTNGRLTPDARQAARLPRGDCDLALLQLAAIDRFNRARRSLELALQAEDRSREVRLDDARSLDALRRQHQALVARTQHQLTSSGELLRSDTPVRVVLAHRDAQFLDVVRSALTGQGLVVLAQTDDGAEAVGCCVAEQPDLLLLEDALLVLPGEEVVRQVRRYVPNAVIGAQTADSQGVARLADAGADAVFTGQVPPREVVRSLMQLSPV